MSGQAARLKHQRIAAELADEIHRGRLANGTQLPGEHALANRFDVSRTTVRQALAELGSQGLIATRSGKGSFVTFDDREIDDRFGWTRALADHGVRTTTRTVRLALVSEPDLAWRLRLPSPEFVAVDRVRSIADGPAVSFECSRIPALDHLRTLPERGLSDSLHTDLRSAGLIPAGGEEWADLAQLDDAAAGLLGRAPGEWFLRTRRRSFDADGRFVEHVESLLDPARFRLHLRFGVDR
jgi:GntR family transcriptional regulator